MSIDKTVEHKFGVDIPELVTGSPDCLGSEDGFSELALCESPILQNENQNSQSNSKQTAHSQTSKALTLPTWSAIISVSLFIPLTMVLNSLGVFWFIIFWPPWLELAVRWFEISGCVTLYFCYYAYRLHTKLRTLNLETPRCANASKFARLRHSPILCDGLGMLLALLALVLRLYCYSLEPLLREQPQCLLMPGNTMVRSIAFILADNICPGLVAFFCIRIFGSVVSSLNAKAKNPIGLRLHPLMIGLALAWPIWCSSDCQDPGLTACMYLLKLLSLAYAFKLLRDIIRATNTTFSLEADTESVTPWWLSSKLHLPIALAAFAFMELVWSKVPTH